MSVRETKDSELYASICYLIFKFCWLRFVFLILQVISGEVIKHLFGPIPTPCRRTHEKIISLARNNWWKCHKGFYWAPETPASVSKVDMSFYRPYGGIDFPLIISSLVYFYPHRVDKMNVQWKNYACILFSSLKLPLLSLHINNFEINFLLQCTS